MARAIKGYPSSHYHADHSKISWSMLKTFVDAPELYSEYFIEQVARPKSTSSMKLGQIVHALILTPDNLDFVELPDDIKVRRGEKFREFARAHAGKTVVTQSEARIATLVAQGVENSPMAREVLAGAEHTEHTIFFGEDLPRKCRIDIYGDGFIADLKCVQDPTPQAFRKKCRELMYHRQAAYYCDGYEAIRGKRPAWYFLAVRNSHPYECYVYKLSEKSLLSGKEANDEDLARLKECTATGNFRRPQWHQISDLEV